MRRVTLFLICLLLAACARPVSDIPSASYSSMKNEIRQETGDILMKYVAAQQRLLTIAGPLLIANAPLCPRHVYTPGFVVWSYFDLPKELQDVAYERMQLGSDAVVTAVIPGTSAWDAGIRAGDIVATMDGKRVRNAADLRARVRKFHHDDVTFGLIRNAQSFTAMVTFVPYCNYPLIYDVANREINAGATGRSIIVNQGMMDFTNDRELAGVIGHELAHNIMHHIPKGQINESAVKIAGGVVDGLTALIGWNTDVTGKMLDAYTHLFSARFEQEADYVGMYLVARAGGDITAIAPFWRRMAAEHGITAVTLPAGEIRTHPDSPERFVVLSETRKEIEAKIKAGQPLMPNLRTGFQYGQKFWPWEDDTDNDDEPDDTDLNH